MSQILITIQLKEALFVHETSYVFHVIILHCLLKSAILENSGNYKFCVLIDEAQ